jgi:type IV secretory pathway component VirB8
MFQVEIYGRVRRAVRVEGRSQRAVAREFGLSRETASVTYVFRENVKNNELAVNPLGLTIVRFRADQAFN